MFDLGRNSLFYKNIICKMKSISSLTRYIHISNWILSRRKKYFHFNF